jgi:hypothetical protein
MASAQISRSGLPGLLKEGTKHLAGVEGVILKNSTPRPARSPPARAPSWLLGAPRS